MKLLKRIVILLAIAFVVAVGLSFVAPDLFSKGDVDRFLNAPGENIQQLAGRGASAAREVVSSAAEKVQKEAVSTVIDQSGIKAAAVEELHAHAGDIAYATGLDSSMVDYVIDAMDIPNWQTTSLPDEHYVATSVPFTYAGASATLTTYADPSYVTVEAYGQDITFAVPDQAQAYIPYLSYISY